MVGAAAGAFLGAGERTGRRRARCVRPRLLEVNCRLVPTPPPTGLWAGRRPFLVTDRQAGVSGGGEGVAKARWGCSVRGASLPQGNLLGLQGLSQSRPS